MQIIIFFIVARNYRSQWNYHHPEGRYAPPVHADEERPSIPSPVVHTPPSESGPNKPPRRAESPASSVSSRHLISKRRRSRYYLYYNYQIKLNIRLDICTYGHAYVYL